MDRQDVPLTKRPIVPPHPFLTGRVGPRWLHWLFQRELWIILGLCACYLTVWMIIIRSAWGAGATLPERQDALCAKLQQSPGCTWSYEPGKKLRGTLTIAVADEASEPNAPLTWPHWHTSTLIFRPRGSTAPLFAQSAVINDGANATDALTYLQQPPCVEAYPNCRAARDVTPPTYTGATRTDIATPATILNALRWQMPSDAMIAELQRYAGASGIPVIAMVSPRSIAWLVDGPSVIPSTRSIDVVMLFAVP